MNLSTRNGFNLNCFMEFSRAYIWCKQLHFACVRFHKSCWKHRIFSLKFSVLHWSILKNYLLNLWELRLENIWDAPLSPPSPLLLSHLNSKHEPTRIASSTIKWIDFFLSSNHPFWHDFIAVLNKSLLWKFVKFDDGNPLVELHNQDYPCLLHLP